MSLLIIVFKQFHNKRDANNFMEFKSLNEVKKTEGPPKVVSLFTKNETEELIQLNNDLPTTIYNKKQNVVKKRWLQNYNEKLDKLYISKLKEVLGDFTMDNLKSDSGEDFFGLFQESFAPLKLHVDSGFDLGTTIYKQTLVPLSAGETIIFENRWYNQSTNFTIDKEELDLDKSLNQRGRNKRSSEHINMYNKKDFNKIEHEKYLAHENINNLKGLKILMVYKWKIGDILIFDRTNLHCSSCNIIDKKLGLTTFTKR